MFRGDTDEPNQRLPGERWLRSSERLSGTGVLQHLPGQRAVEEIGVTVGALSRQDIEVVEALRIAVQVPFANDGRVVTGVSHEARQVLTAVGVPAVVDGADTVNMPILPGHHACPCRGADGVGAVETVHPQSFAPDPVQVRGPECRRQP